MTLIIDDTDAPKSGRKSELIGKVFSHLGGHRDRYIDSIA